MHNRSTALRVGIADDSALFRHGLELQLDQVGIVVTGTYGTAAELIESLDRDRPDVAILDLRMPPDFDAEGLVAAATIRRDHPGVGVLVLSTYVDTSHAAELLTIDERGLGYLLKDRVADASSIAEALNRIDAGECVIDPDIVLALLRRDAHRSTIAQLSVREREVLAMMAEGRSNSAIADAMYLSERTVESHATAIFGKLRLPADPNVNRRVQAVVALVRQG